MAAPAQRCVAVLGGSFDPVHSGHVQLAEHFVRLLQPDQLRVIPAGNPWQKHGLQAEPAQRVEMVRRAFDSQQVPVEIDEQEIRRPSATYTIDTLRALRAELGPAVSIVFLMGADQLQHLDTWQNWRELFDHAHLCAASRPGFGLQAGDVPPAVVHEFAQRAGTPEAIRTTSHGLGCLAPGLAVDISSTAIRAALQRGERPDSLIPTGVLDYIEQQHLYQDSFHD
ncbi:nicotinate (nicotinamide) nucleotide adenylyltransferase [Herbaspirillum sp. alder98]|uniref:nicotinate (nicotinamide) nucleotide adenylyltransferase n=1 Tax=Herbaspirillum sp. alder98 TaxID=2913096 RepID=UPI001CD876A4|nr:nicotinate (nicotinamide) nucleotide adenylyltransferase [Herbaspirillum sp. alder98]MCA1324803.1 nicotinate (nicotinamide) nucleotide adenylyltransferase [Herbaspirillum sp. alder98]